MTRLPVPGGDNSKWGNILNNYLLASHNADGSLKNGVVGSDQLSNGSVTGAKIADNMITANKLTSTVRDQLNAVGSGGATNLSSSSTTTDVTVASDTGTDATLGAATASAAGVMTASDKTKLDTVSVNATNNSTDSQLRDRSTHTGVQAISTVTGLQGALDGKANSTDLALVATSGSYNDLSDRPASQQQFNPIAGTNVTLSGTYPDITFNATPGAGVTDLLVSTTASTIVVESSTGDDATLDAATTSSAGVLSAVDKSKLDGVAAGATANSTDTQLRDRSTHTGTQPVSSVSGLQSALDGKANSSHTHDIADVSGLQSSLDSKADANAVVTSANSTISGIEYYADEASLPVTGVSGVLYVTPIGN